MAQGGAGRATAETTVKGKKISISYGQPELKGRDLAAEAPVGTVWRLGMNEATEITTAGTLDVAGTKVAPGKYSLWAKKVGANEWHLAFHPKTGVWGAPELKEGYIAELPLKLSTNDTSVEKMTIELGDESGMAVVKIEWGKMVLTGTMAVS
jgi:hypothetical protein